MKLMLKKSVWMTFTCAAIVCAPSARAGHATNFLEVLQIEVTNRVANPGTNSTTVDQRALSAAARTLNRNTKTLAADVNALGTAATRLNARFSNDVTFSLLEDATIAAYSAAAHAQLDADTSLVSTSSIPKNLSKSLAKADAALLQADGSTSSVPVHARALASALNKIRSADMKVRRLFKAPPSLAGQRVTAFEDAVVNDRTTFFLSGDTETYVSDNPEELGLWDYQRTSPTTGVITLRSNYPDPGYTPRPMTLTFSDLEHGTFTGTDITGQRIRGTFTVEPQP